MESSSVRSLALLLCSLSLSFTFIGIGCSHDSSSAPSEEIALSESQETASIAFHYSPGDFVESARQQAFHDWAIRELGVSPTRKISFNKYLTRNHMGLLTGAYSTNAYADPSQFALHTIFPFDNHESVHLYTSLFGSAPGLFNEGIAVAFQTDPSADDFIPRWSGEPVHDVARRLRSQGNLAPISSMLTTRDFLLVPDDVRYPEAGSFVRFLIDTRGLEPMRELFRLSSPEDPADAVRERFHDVYGGTVEDVETEWLRFLDSISSARELGSPKTSAMLTTQFLGLRPLFPAR
jgi:hypothetical protein